MHRNSSSRKKEINYYYENKESNFFNVYRTPPIDPPPGLYLCVGHHSYFFSSADSLINSAPSTTRVPTGASMDTTVHE
jgi:hypothetical protein